MEGEPLRVAVAVAPDRRVRSRAPDERVVLGDAPVRHHAVDLARGERQALRLVLHAAVAARVEEVALAVARESTAVMSVTAAEDTGGGLVDELLVDPGSVAHVAAHDRRHRDAPLALDRVAQVDPAVLRVVGVECYVQEPAVLLDPDLRKAADRVGEGLA